MEDSELEIHERIIAPVGSNIARGLQTDSRLGANHITHLADKLRRCESPSK